MLLSAITLTAILLLAIPLARAHLSPLWGGLLGFALLTATILLGRLAASFLG